MSRVGSRQLMVAGQLLTAVASLVYVVPHLSPAWMIAAAVGRGAGMGVAIVVSVAVLSDLTAARRQGTAIGHFGLALSLPGVFVPSLGVYLLAQGRLDLVAGIAFMSGGIGALVALAIPNGSPRSSAPMAALIANIRHPRVLMVLTGFVLISCSFGGVFTYAPIALPLQGIGSATTFLLVAGASRALSRWLAGPLGDRRSVRQIVIAADALVLLSLALLAFHVQGATLLAVALVYGLGYGAIQTTAFLALAQSAHTREVGAVSTLWNTATDLGSAMGGALLGLAAAQYGYATAIWVLPIVVAMSVALLAVSLPSGAQVSERAVPVAK
jgi:predicted MFS family arabinose efflux permease